MKYSKWHILSIVIISLLSACTAGIFEVELPFNENTIVVNGFVDATGAELSLRRAVNPNDTIFFNQEYALPTARVRIQSTLTGTVLTDTVVGGAQATHFFPFSAPPADTFMLTVESEGYPTAVVTDIFLPNDFIDFNVSFSEVDTAGFAGTILYDLKGEITYTIDENTPPEAFLLAIANGDDSDFLFQSFLSELEEDVNTACSISRGKWLSWSTRCFEGEERVTLPVVLDFVSTEMVNALSLSLSSVQEVTNQHLDSFNQSGDTFDRIFVEANATVFNVRNGYGLVTGRVAKEIRVSF